MRRRSIPARALVACAVLALLTACGGGTAERARPSGTSSGGTEENGDPVATPTASRPPAEGKGSEDPDDINGDGHRDLLIPVGGGSGAGERTPRRVAVVFGSAGGPDPATRTVHDRASLVPRPREPDRVPRNGIGPAQITTADLDGDGYPDFVTQYSEPLTREEAQRDTGGHAQRSALAVSWGGPAGPAGPRDGTPPTTVRPAGNTGAGGLDAAVRGDFDGDGHHDLAALRQDGTAVLILHGPFSRSGVPARTDTRPGTRDARRLIADDIDPTGEPRATGLLVHRGGDGEQVGGLFYTARRGSGLAASGEEVRKGNAVAFGDFDGDGLRDLAVGDDGGRNDEPGYRTEAPEVHASLAVHPGTGGSPRTVKLPETRKPYGPGGYSAADPDGDGRDALLVATDDGALLIDLLDGEGDRRTEVLRRGPARVPGEPDGKSGKSGKPGKSRTVPAGERTARPYGAADFDGDGRDELVLNWAAHSLFDFYGEDPTHWWITRGTGPGNMTAFTTTPFLDGDTAGAGDGDGG
ncbi:FG-GAP and VCBS repeat-containing protein [Streptomyces xinghaiensis]|uniref:FG-GAP and VCBS repeat-containing protein n=1 Tax=Streptomyces xinghaiensis TaxID=1038928 RepID=UPI002E0DE4D2|nr:VCBS repeat-containing protein [Streptomyces xinghaiensis]